MKDFITYIGVFAGIMIGEDLGGLWGSVLGGVAAFIAAIFIFERIESTRSTSGFWLRHRGRLISFVASILCVIVSQAILPGFLGIIGGIYVGQVVGDAITEKLGWGGSALQGQIEFRGTYVAVLVSAASADGNISEKERRLILKVAKDLFSSLGYGDDADAHTLIDSLIENPVGPQDIGTYVNALNMEFQHFIFLDMCKVLFADGEMSSKEIEWLRLFYETAQIKNTSALTLFTRNQIFANNHEKECLEELGLPLNATESDITRAYRQLAMKYHPDLQESMPQHVRELIAKKMVALNEAYAFLTNKTNTTTLSFKGTNGSTFSPKGSGQFECLCWLCSQNLRIPEIADPKSARCPKCHALVGLTFDPNATS